MYLSENIYLSEVLGWLRTFGFLENPNGCLLKTKYITLLRLLSQSHSLVNSVNILTLPIGGGNHNKKD